MHFHPVGAGHENLLAASEGQVRFGTSTASKVLVANRGLIAAKAVRRLQEIGCAVVAVAARDDRHAPHATAADETALLDGGPVSETYANDPALVRAARDHGCHALWPGYGFLSESEELAAACADAGILFIVPACEQLRPFGLKHLARKVVAEAGIPLPPGSDVVSSADEAVEAAARIGFPVMVKSTAGGGGIGLARCDTVEEVAAEYESVRNLAGRFFGNGSVFVERCIERARHIEVQIVGDGRGGVLVFGDRECSLQRRSQKVVEEAPAPRLGPQTRKLLHEAAAKLARHVNCQCVGTVEFVLDDTTGDFFFLETNPRLQLEHGVTDAVFGVDLIAWMVRLARGEQLRALAAEASPDPHGCAIDTRVYAECPLDNFRPSAGAILSASFPEGEGITVDTWVSSGSVVTPLYDPLLANVIVHAASRQAAVAASAAALEDAELAGIETNLAYRRAIVASDGFARAEVSTSSFRPCPSSVFSSPPPALASLLAGSAARICFLDARGVWTLPSLSTRSSSCSALTWTARTSSDLPAAITGNGGTGAVLPPDGRAVPTRCRTGSRGSCTGRAPPSPRAMRGWSGACSRAHRPMRSPPT